MDYNLATSANFLNAERLFNKMPDILYCEAQEIWTNLGPISVAEIVEKSGVDTQEFSNTEIIVEQRSMSQLKNSKHKNIEHTEFSLIDGGSYNR